MNNVLSRTSEMTSLVNDSVSEKNSSNNWVVVENAGTDNESFVADFDTWMKAARFVRNQCAGDIMRRLENGFLTTEY
jgi:hypothetical protein